MTRREYRASTRTKRPYHIEAQELGADLAAIKAARSCSSAAEIGAVWSYRTAGLTVDQARGCLSRWLSHHYHRIPLSESPGRYEMLQDQVRGRRARYQDWVAGVLRLADGLPTWDRPAARWQAGDRVLLTRHYEYVEWGRKNGRYPTHTQVSYTTHLLRADWQITPHTREILGKHRDNSIRERKPLALASEATTTHDGRGHWQQRALDTLLPGVDYIAPPPPITVAYKRVARVGDRLLSIYDGVTEYRIGEVTTAKICDEHSGIFVRPTAKGAKRAAVPDSSRLADAPYAILRCECYGESAQHNGKTAYEHCRPVEVVALST